ncbi:MAG: DUF1573 domain-containing protein [Sphingobacterium sp.]|jgi:hypothetical protein|nr:DUF1573 domain-containing protein [Sphingobacterium sp.]
MKLLSYLLFTLIAIVSCTPKEENVQTNRTYEEILKTAQQKKLPFCIVLTDSTQSPSKEYLESINGTYNYIADNAIFNIIDVSSKESKVYLKTFVPTSLPLTCIFSSDGKLIDLIPGIAKESFLYMEQAFKEGKTTQYHWPNSFQKNKETLMPILKQLVDFENNLGNKNYKWEQYAHLSDSLKYPYIDYLLMKAAVITNDTDLMISRAQKLLSTESSRNLELYKEEFIEAKKIIDPTFNIANAPSIRTTNKNIVLSDLKIGQSIPLDIILYNDGKESLKIEKIDMSCSCVTLEGINSEIVIGSGKKYTARFYFKPTDSGELTRDIFIYSNAINQPNLHINILAHVKS